MHYNMINEVMNAQISSTNPFVGMCGTMFCGSDRWPMVVTEVISDKKIRIANMFDSDYNSEKTLDHKGNEYLMPHNMGRYVKLNEDKTNIIPFGEIYTYRKNKRWIKEGHSLWETGAVHLGKADEYRDPDL